MTTKHSRTFHLYGGKKFSDLKGLAKELKDMGDEVFSHHVSAVKNDFATWMKFSLKEEKLANKVERTIDKIQTELEVLRHLVHEAKAASKAKKKAAVKKPIVKEEKKAEPKKPVKKATKKVAKKKVTKEIAKK